MQNDTNLLVSAFRKFGVVGNCVKPQTSCGLTTEYNDPFVVDRSGYNKPRNVDKKINFQSLIPTKTNIFYALDFDNCLMNDKVIATLKELARKVQVTDQKNNHLETDSYFDGRLAAVIEHNQQLLNEINRLLPLDEYRKFVTIFSNRQCRINDEFNYYDDGVFLGSCFKIYQQLFSQSTSLRFVPILLPDCLHDLTIGTTYNKLTEPTYTASHHNYPLDRYKTILAYEQAHYAASRYPNDINIIKIYDDCCDPENLKADRILNRLLFTIQNFPIYFRQM